MTKTSLYKLQDRLQILSYVCTIVHAINFNRIGNGDILTDRRNVKARVKRKMILSYS